jgi:hypothetical protein
MLFDQFTWHIDYMKKHWCYGLNPWCESFHMTFGIGFDLCVWF